MNTVISFIIFRINNIIDIDIGVENKFKRFKKINIIIIGF